MTSHGGQSAAIIVTDRTSTFPLSIPEGAQVVVEVEVVVDVVVVGVVVVVVVGCVGRKYIGLLVALG